GGSRGCRPSGRRAASRSAGRRSASVWWASLHATAWFPEPSEQYGTADGGGGEAVGHLADPDPVGVEQDDGEEVRVAGRHHRGPHRFGRQRGEGEERDAVPGLDGRR